MDLRGKVQKLNLKGHGKEYFENPELIPSNIYPLYIFLRRIFINFCVNNL
jgi:hypothetical protein